MNPDASPALLTKTELDWLQHKIKVSKVYEYRLKRAIGGFVKADALNPCLCNACSIIVTISESSSTARI